VYCCNDCALLYFLVLFVSVFEAGYCCNDCARLSYLVLFVTVVEALLCPVAIEQACPSTYFVASLNFGRLYMNLMSGTSRRLF